MLASFLFLKVYVPFHKFMAVGTTDDLNKCKVLVYILEYCNFAIACSISRVVRANACKNFSKIVRH